MPKQLKLDNAIGYRLDQMVERMCLEYGIHIPASQLAGIILDKGIHDLSKDLAQLTIYDLDH